MSAFPVPSRSIRIENVVVNSHFIATVGRADSVEEAKAFIQTIRDEMPDASHHVYAFKIGYGSSIIEGMTDDGEPSGTAGPPVLAILRGTDIGNVVVVVTRYFGGTKLGTGGLVRAYSGAARDALAVVPTELKVEKRLIGISIGYSLYERMKLLLADYRAEIDNEEFGAEVTVYALLPADQLPAFTEALSNLTSGQVAPILLDESDI